MSESEIFEVKKHGERFIAGSVIGITGMIISSLSQELCGHKLGYGKIGVRNVFKITLSSGLTTVLVMKGAEYKK